MSLSRALRYSVIQRPRFLAELKDFIRFPTVSAQSKFAVDMRRCAAWLASDLRRSGLKGARVIANGEHPLVYASWRHAPRRPTVLIYGHYDVQPPEPLHEWITPPFEPTVRGRDLYGRGACDDKGQMFAHVKALECYLRTRGRLPVNVVCLFEGAEEIGSKNLSSILQKHRSSFAADVAILSDMRIPAPNRPAIDYAVRGSLAVELEVRGPGHDLHSGEFGGAVHNPLQALAEILSKLHDERGRIAIPGFYRRVRVATTRERDYLKRVGPTDKAILEETKARGGWGEHGYTLFERTTLRPALTINGLVGGYQGPGGKGVIPAAASAKLSFRLVPDQDPHEVDRLFRAQIERITPPTVRSIVRSTAAARPAVVSLKHPAIRAAAVACRKGFGSEPVFLRSGGTIPVVDAFQKVLGIPTVIMGFALPNSRIHAPNERLHLPNFYNGIDTGIWFMTALAATQRHSRKPEISRSFSRNVVP